MDILQDTVGGIGHFKAEIRFKPTVPLAFQINNIQFASDQFPFQLETQQDMEVVVHFVGFGTNEARFDPVDCSVEISGVVELAIWKGLNEMRRKPVAE